MIPQLSAVSKTALAKPETVCAICLRPVEPRKECVRCLLRVALETGDTSEPVSAGSPISSSGSESMQNLAGTYRTGAHFQHYRLVTHSDGSPYELGRGGMGVTYKAFDENLHCYVAVKVIHPHLLHNAQVRERFMREARQAARLRHPNVASVFHLGEQKGVCFYALEFIDGENVEQLVERSGPVTPRFALQVAAEVASALAAAATLRLIHRDLKPSNLMLMRSEPGEVKVKVIDFGVGLLLEPEAAEDNDRLIRAGMVGTAQFASPEQLRNNPVDARSDIYSLGATLWFMLNGESPPCELGHTRFGNSVPPLPAPLARLLKRTLESDPAARPQTAAALQRDLASSLEQISGETGSIRIVSSRSRARRFPLLLAWATAAVLLAGGGYALWRNSARKENEMRSTPAAPEKTQTIAVLPLHALGGDPESAQLAEAIHDEVLSTLARNKRLQVISQGSVLNPRLTSMTPAEQGRMLGAGILMEGSLQRSGKQFRVNARMVEAANGRTLHAGNFVGERTNLFALEQQIAAEMTAQLQPDRPTQPAMGVPTENMEAYESYLQGREWERKVDSYQGVKAAKAAEFYERAVGLDPTFALAYAALASVSTRLYWQEDNWDTRQAYLTKARRAVAEAVKLQPNLPEVHAALGYYYYYSHRDYDHAQQEFREAEKNLPNDSDVALALALVLRRKGAWDDAIASFQRASRLDPLSSRILSNLADTYSGLRRYEEEEQVFARKLALKPDDPELRLEHAYLQFKRTGYTAELRRATEQSDRAYESHDTAFARWDVNMLERKFDQAITEIRKSSRPEFETEFAIFPKDLLCALASAAKGDAATARASFEQSRLSMEPVVQKNTQGPRLRVALALAYAGLNRKTEAVEQARLAIEERSSAIDPVGGPPIAITAARVSVILGDKQEALRQLGPLLKMPFGLSLSRARFDPAWDSLRGMPEFEALLK